MRISHQFKDYCTERDISDSAPLSFFIPNKIGGMLFLDAKNDEMQYYAKIGGTVFKIIDNINSEGKITAVKNRLHTLEIDRNDKKTEVFVPYFTNSMLIKSQQPMQINLDMKETEGKIQRKCTVTEKGGRILVKSEKPNGKGAVFMAIQGENLKYDHDKKKNVSSVYIYSPRISMSVSDNEEHAIKSADHMFSTEQEIRKVQDKYLDHSKQFKSPEHAIAYSCVLNGTDGIFSQQNSEEPTVETEGFFSNASRTHKTIAAASVFMEGEFQSAKQALLGEVKKHLLIEDFDMAEAAWSTILFGRFLNNLCKAGQMKEYFSSNEIKDLAESIHKLAFMIRKEHKGNQQSYTSIDNHALVLSVNDLAYALTKSGVHIENDPALRDLLRNSLKQKQTSSINSDIGEIFMTAYIYPALMQNEEWKKCFDGILTNGLKYDSDNISLGAIDLEPFGMSCISATVLHRMDAEHYKDHISGIVDESVERTLYNGLVGRPTRNGKEAAGNKKGIIQDTHLLNNAFFLEMLRECA